MAGSDLVISMKLTADGGQFTGTIDKGRDSLKGFTTQVDKAGREHAAGRSYR